jgi:2-methylisocitrate lyase-like PEP mutase family enzyme
VERWREVGRPDDDDLLARRPGGEVLRELLAGPTILEQPSVCDLLGARMAQDAGFEAVALAGYAIGAHLPLTRSLSIDDVEATTAAVAGACTVPLLVDADAGWGGIDSVPAAVRRLESAGAAALQLSSQHIPDCVPYADAEERPVAHRDLVSRVSAALGARQHVLVFARVDVVADDGYDAALRHADALRSAGADAILVYSERDAEVRRLPKDLPDVPLIYAGDPRATCGRSVYDVERLEQWGYRGVRNKYHRCYCARMVDQARERRPAAPMDKRG